MKRSKLVQAWHDGRYLVSAAVLTVGVRLSPKCDRVEMLSRAHRWANAQ